MIDNGHKSAEDSNKKWFNDRVILPLNCIYYKHEMIFTERYFIPEKQCIIFSQGCHWDNLQTFIYYMP